MYENLPTPDSIRLLHICKSEIGKISVTLTVHVLSQTVPFRALSYTWGPPTRGLFETEAEQAIELQTIQCNEKDFSVRQNLFDALCQISAEDCPGYLWVDAICINQEDVIERNAQVALMGQLYNMAEEVYIWLGKDESGIEDVNWATREFLPAIERIRRDKGPDFAVSEIENRELGTLIGIDDYSRQLRRYFAFTYRRTWFRRSWTLQEVVNSRRLSLSCGQHHLDWDAMCKVEEFVSKTNWHHLKIEIDTHSQGDPDKVEDAPNISLFVTLIDSISHWTKPSEASIAASVSNIPEAMAREYGAETEAEMAPVFYGALLFNVFSQACTDPRDHIYSRFGILRSCFPGRQTDMFLPDYNLSAQEVYYLTAKNILENSPLLVAVGDLTAPRTVPDIPSWVPEYGESMGQRITHIGVKFDASNFYSSDRPAAPRHTIQGNVLLAHGFCFDVVAVPNPEMSSKISFLLDILVFCRDLAKKSVTGDDPLETFWRARIFNQDSTGASPASCDLRTSFRAYLTMVTLLAFMEDNQFADEPVKPGEVRGSIKDFYRMYFEGWQSEYSEAILPPFHQLTEASDLMYEGSARADMSEVHTLLRALQKEATAWQALTVHRSTNKIFFKTERRLLGLTEDEGQKGDEVWCITTSLVPLILRPLGNGQRQVVGQAYLHGFMHGEMLDERWGCKDAIRPVEIV